MRITTTIIRYIYNDYYAHYPTNVNKMIVELPMPGVEDMFQTLRNSSIFQVYRPKDMYCNLATTLHNNNNIAIYRRPFTGIICSFDNSIVNT
jgi:hypothetical protein